MKSTKAYITSGQAVIKPAVLEELKSMGVTPVELGGYDQYETAVNIAKEMQKLGTSFTKLAVVSGWVTPADALSISSIAASEKIPVLATTKSELPAKVKEYLLSLEGSITDSYVIGGTAVVSDVVKESLPGNQQRYYGNTKYDTNLDVLKKFTDNLKYKAVYVANGETLVDALAGVPLAAQDASPIILTDKSMDPSLMDYAKTTISPNVIALGGEIVVNPDTLNRLASYDSETENNQAIGSNNPDLPEILQKTLIISGENVTVENVVENFSTYYYDVFGNIMESTGNVNNPFTYAGYQYDKESNYYYLNARFYDPVTARFLSEDTYAGDKNDPLSLNLYTYCHNEPLMYSDPTGHSWLSTAISVGKSIIKAIGAASKGDKGKSNSSGKGSSSGKGNSSSSSTTGNGGFLSTVVNIISSALFGNNQRSENNTVQRPTPLTLISKLASDINYSYDSRFGYIAALDSSFGVADYYTQRMGKADQTEEIYKVCYSDLTPYYPNDDLMDQYRKKLEENPPYNPIKTGIPYEVDYSNLTISAFGGSRSIIKDRFGHYYDGTGYSEGLPRYSVSFTQGTVEGGLEEDDDAYSFLSGSSITEYGAAGIAGAYTHSSDGRTALEQGLSTPQGGVSYMYYTQRTD